MTISALLAVIGLMATQPALAGRIGSRQTNQNHRIYQGISNGELTAGETRQLVRQQQSIQRHKQIAWADGTLDLRERSRLEREQHRAGRNISRLKHNNRGRKLEAN